MVDSVKNLLGNTRDPVAAWEALEKRFGARQEGIQSSLIAKLQLADWDGQGGIRTYRDHMVELRTQLEDAGMTLTDQAFYSYFVESLPELLDLFITLYEDTTYNVDWSLQQVREIRNAQERPCFQDCEAAVCFRWLCRSLQSATGEEEGD